MTDDGKTLRRPAAAQGHDDLHDPPGHAGRTHRPPAAGEPDQGAADAPPTVQLVEPARETTRGRGEQAADRGPGQRRLRPGRGPRSRRRVEARAADKTGAEVKTVASWSKFTASGAVLSHALELDPARFKAGQTVCVRAVARDRRQIDLPELKLGPQESATPWQPIHLVAAEAKAKAELAQLESLRTALAKILQDQLRARAAAAGLPRLADGSRGRQARRPTSGASRWACRRPPTAVIDVDRLDRRRRAADDQARGQQAGLRRDGPGGPPGRGPGARQGRAPSWPGPRPS